MRSLIYVHKNVSATQLVLKLKNHNTEFEQIFIPRNFKESDFKEVAHKTYDLYLNDQLIESNIPLKLGGVYTVVGYINPNTTAAVRTITVTEPNTFHILWILPQEIILGFSEIMVEIVMTEFGFSQAPTNMKALMQACFLFNAVFGNIIVITVTEIGIFQRKVCKIFIVQKTIFIKKNWSFFRLINYFSSLFWWLSAQWFSQYYLHFTNLKHTMRTIKKTQIIPLYNNMYFVKSNLYVIFTIFLYDICDIKCLIWNPNNDDGILFILLYIFYM